jgi:hypothetical protein
VRTSTADALPAADLSSLGRFRPARFCPIARDVVIRDILDPLATIGVALSADERAEWLV